MAPVESHGTGEVVDLGAGSGPLWGMASHDLNATLLAWGAGEALAEHVNVELRPAPAPAAAPTAAR